MTPWRLLHSLILWCPLIQIYPCKTKISSTVHIHTQVLLQDFLHEHNTLCSVLQFFLRLTWPFIILNFMKLFSTPKFLSSNLSPFSSFSSCSNHCILHQKSWSLGQFLPEGLPLEWPPQTSWCSTYRSGAVLCRCTAHHHLGNRINLNYDISQVLMKGFWTLCIFDK